MDDTESLAPSRRDFLRNVFTATILSAVAPGVVLGRLAPALRMRNASLVGTYRIDLSLAEYEALRNVNGSIKIQVDEVPEFDMPIVVTRTAQDRFAAVYSQCTHSGCEVELYKSTIQCIECKCHGSRFSAEGTVKRGPAPSNLRSFPTTYDGADILEIEIDGLPASIADDLAADSFLSQPIVDAAGATASFEYSLARPADVVISVYTLMGEEMLRIRTGQMQQGTSSASLDVASLPSGVYLLTLSTASGYKGTRRFVISR